MLGRLRLVEGIRQLRCRGEAAPRTAWLWVHRGTVVVTCLFGLNCSRINWINNKFLDPSERRVLLARKGTARSASSSGGALCLTC